MDSVLTFNDVANALGVTVLTVKRWKKRGCRELQVSPYHIPTVRHWRETGENTVPETDDAAQLRIDKLKADIAFTDTKKQLAELKVAIERGELMPTEDVVQAQARMASEIKKTLLALPSAYCDELTNVSSIAETKAILDNMVRDVLRLLSKRDEV